MDYLYADIYKKLEEKIKNMEVGEKLPSERAMVQEYGCLLYTSPSPRDRG